MKTQTNENTFSIELNSKTHLGLNFPKSTQDSVLLEGTLGKLHSLDFVEGVMLELRGNNGVLRMDITESEWDQLRKKEREE